MVQLESGRVSLLSSQFGLHLGLIFVYVPLRISLKTQKATVKNQLNKPTESPTLRWIFQSQCLGLVPRLVREAPLKEAATGVCFQGIHFLITQGVYRILNLTEERCGIWQFLPTACQKYYLFS